MKLNINDTYKCIEEVRQLGYPVCEPGEIITIVSSTNNPEEYHFPHLVKCAKSVGCAHDVGLHDDDMKKFKRVVKLKCLQGGRK